MVIGAGAAGLCVALNAAPRRVLVMAPDSANTSCTELAKGGIAAPLAAQDSVALHVADTTRAADHSGCRAMTQIIIGKALEAINFLEQAGVRFDVSSQGRDLHLEAGHRLPRILHADGDQTGAAIHRALYQRARASSHIEFMTDASAVSLADDGRPDHGRHRSARGRIGARGARLADRARHRRTRPAVRRDHQRQERLGRWSRHGAGERRGRRGTRVRAISSHRLALFRWIRCP